MLRTAASFCEFCPCCGCCGSWQQRHLRRRSSHPDKGNYCERLCLRGLGGNLCQCNAVHFAGKRADHLVAADVPTDAVPLAKYGDVDDGPDLVTEDNKRRQRVAFQAAATRCSGRDCSSPIVSSTSGANTVIMESLHTSGRPRRLRVLRQR